MIIWGSKDFKQIIDNQLIIIEGINKLMKVSEVLTQFTTDATAQLNGIQEDVTNLVQMVSNLQNQLVNQDMTPEQIQQALQPIIDQITNINSQN